MIKAEPGWMLLALAMSLTACHPAARTPAPPASVIALPVEHGSATADVTRYPVEVSARYTNPMSFRVSGKIVERTVRLGDRVKRGQVLARLDPVDLQKQVISAEAVVAASEHRLLYAQQQLARDQAQSERDLIAANQLEQTQDAYSSARAQRDQASAQLLLAQNSLAYTQLSAEHDGVITSEDADTGQVVSAGQAVYGLAWSGDIDVVLDAAESQLGRFKVGTLARVSFPALPGPPFEARVREIAPAADPQSRTYRVKLTLQTPPEGVRLGMTGEAMLAAPQTSAAAADESHFRLPATAIFHQDSEPAVWIVAADSTLQLRAVQVARYDERSVQVTRGLEDGDVVVLAGVHTVYAGERVRTVGPLFDDSGNISGPAPQR